ncbi:hypothetical protein CEXT_622031 [Caerostris extrusa]|uniref:Uncharacterized protein n=1 Tax=Caerostris extrusa TaxID=172846 RepID=A0AAV4YAM0_CAEEX|nr:hypothetical protein CEXT_622031 [Caerostris extrusa]
MLSSQAVVVLYRVFETLTLTTRTAERARDNHPQVIVFGGFISSSHSPQLQNYGCNPQYRIMAAISDIGGLVAQ